MAGLVQTVAPADYPVSVQEVKDQLRILDDYDDGYITICRNAAVLQVEAWQHRQLINATYKMYLDCFPHEPKPRNDIILPRAPLSSVTSVEYIDYAGTTQTWSSSEYIVDTNSTQGRIRPDPSYTYPSVGTEYMNNVIVTFVAGYGTSASDVPDNTRQGIMIWAAHLYEQREPIVIGKTVNEVPLFMKSLISSEAILETN